MTRYRYYGLDNDRNEIASGTVEADDVDAAIKAAEEDLGSRGIDKAG